MAARKKPKSQRQDNRPQRNKSNLAVVPQVVDDKPANAEVNVPPMPALDAGEEWTDESVLLWQTYWSSEIASAAIGVDPLIAERWIFAHEEWRLAMYAVRKNRTVAGSTGQLTMNPLAAWAKSQAEEMRKCEASLGIGPKERAALGLEVGKGKLTAAQLNKMTQEGRRDKDAGPSKEAQAVFDEFESEAN